MGGTRKTHLGFAEPALGFLAIAKNYLGRGRDVRKTKQPITLTHAQALTASQPGAEDSRRNDLVARYWAECPQVAERLDTRGREPRHDELVGVLLRSVEWDLQPRLHPAPVSPVNRFVHHFSQHGSPLGWGIVQERSMCTTAPVAPVQPTPLAPCRRRVTGTMSNEPPSWTGDRPVIRPVPGLDPPPGRRLRIDARVPSAPLAAAEPRP
jgi:hypothetical protein